MPGRTRPEVRVIPLQPGHRPTVAPIGRQLSTNSAARARGETGTGGGLSLTLAFLIAGAVIVAALTFWSGPEREGSSISVQQPDSAAPVR